MPNDVFRPRLPLDPFAALDHPPPWHITSPDPPTEPLAHIVLVLGAPSHTDLVPLVTSSHLVHSLIIIATSTPPPVPNSPHAHGPAIIILHLPAPLDIHDSGAVRLVSLLDRAQRVAHSWRTATLPQRHIQQFAELYPGGEFTISEDPELAVSHNPVLPRKTSSSPLASDADDSASLSSSSTASTSSSFRRPLKSPKHKSSKQNQAQFSALINFLPPSLPDKALLKHAILVTTLSAPFLASPTSTPSFSPYQRSISKRPSIFSSLSLTSVASQIQSQNPRRSRLSSLFSSAPAPSSSGPTPTPPSAYSSPPSLWAASRAPSVESLALTAKHPHLVHVLPYSAASASSSLATLVPPHPHRSTTAPVHLTPHAALPNKRQSLVPGGAGTHKSKLVQSIEQFLLSFAYPPSASASSPSLGGSTSSTPLIPGTGAARSPLRSSPLANQSVGLSVKDGKRRSVVRTSSILMPSGPTTTTTFPPSLGHLGQEPGAFHAVPYLLPAGVLGASPSFPSNSSSMGAISIGELILLGMLDVVATGLGGGEEGREGWPRAWVGMGGEVEVEVGACVSPSGSGSGSGLNSRQGSVGRSVGFGVGVREDGKMDGKGGVVAVGTHEVEDIPKPQVNPELPPQPQTPQKGKGGKSKSKVRRNEAGLPTPPESSSSLDDGESDDDVSFVEYERAVPSFPFSQSPDAVVVGEEMETGTEKLVEKEGGMEGKERRRLGGRVSRFFGGGRREGREGCEDEGGGGGAFGRLRRVWA
ncbi:hypothetical protein FPV67DRAFT_1760975 [Lyophyllum atratum]|nr:hypothetical protein FPV67DRAFT_1760975 [Lyophyllum atratum]